MNATNKYPGKCFECGKWVPEYAGTRGRQNGKWVVYCAEHQQANTTAAPEVAPVKRELFRHGDRLAVRTPRGGPEQLALCRALPRAYWDRDSKVWTCSADLQDRPRVLELAGKLGCEIPMDLLMLDRPVEVEAAEARAEAIPTIRDYQIKGAGWLALRKTALLGDDMGLGKTLQVLCALPEKARAVIVCPASIKFVWRDECAKWRPDLTVTVLAGRNSFRAPKAGELVVLNYDILPADIDGHDLEGVKLIADEAQRVKNYKAQRSKKLAALGKACTAGTWLLTGTPLMNRPGDLYGLLSAGAMAHEVFGSFARMAGLFGGVKGRWGWEWPDFASNPHAVSPEVPERLRRVMLRRLKRDVLPELPRKQYQAIEVNGLSAGMRKKLDALWELWGDLLTAGVDVDDTPEFEEYSRIRAALAAEKLPALIERIESYEDAGEPIVVFSAHRAPIETLAQREGWAMIAGGISAEARAEAVQNFQTGKLKGLAITIAAGGEGLTLTRASHALFVDLAWRPADNQQAEDRLVRIGQDADSVHIESLVIAHPLELAVHAMLTDKAAMIDQAIEAEATINLAAEAEGEAARIRAEQEARERAAAYAKQVHDIQVEQVLSRQRKRGFSKSEDDLTAAVRADIVGAHGYLCSVCDGAQALDGAGYNKPDAAIAHRVSAYDLQSDSELLTMWAMLRKYHKQCKSQFPSLF